MIKVKDCFCGCTLRTGTMLLILLVLIATGTSIYRNISYCYEQLHYHDIPPEVPGFSIPSSHSDKTDNIYTADDVFCSYFEIIYCIIGFISSVVAIIGILKESPNFMIPFLLYMGFFVVICVLLMLLVIISPDWFNEIVPFVSMDLEDYVHPKSNYAHLKGGDAHPKDEEKQNSVVRLRVIFACLATGVIYLYFFIIIKSYRTSMLPNHDNHNKQKGSDTSAVTIKLDRT